MNFNKKSFIKVLLSLGMLTTLTSCKGDDRYPRSFTVNFVVDEHSNNIDPVIVKEGYTIQNVSTPTNDIDAIFLGWYIIDEEGNELEYFDIDTYRVFDNITLKAKWIYPSNAPQEISLGSDAFTKSLVWIQKDINVNDIGVRARIGYVETLYEYNEQYDKNLISGYGIKYPDENYVEIEGIVSKDGYNYTFTLNEPTNNYYGIQIYSKSGSFETVDVNDIHFKGKGTQEDPYLVYNETDLKYLTVNSFDENTYVQLMNDVTISSLYNEKTNAIFNGHIDGSKSYVNSNDNDNYSITIRNNSGLFMILGEKATVTNIDFKGSISGNNPSIGVVANYSYGKITKVNSVAVSVSSHGGKVNNYETFANGGSGGLVGTNYGEIYNCTVTSAQDNTVTGNIAVGGVAGVNYGKIHDMRVDAIVGAYNGNEISTTVENSYSGCVCGINFGNVYKIDVYNGKINTRRIDDGEFGEGSNCVGGVCGYNTKDGVIQECLFDGMRIVGDTNVGGIVGYNDGTIDSCYTGRRLRSPSNTTIAERRFISPVTGSYNVGGIAGLCGENSKITHVFSTANVWSYMMEGYSVASKADNAISVMYNQHDRNANTYPGRKYGVPYSSDLIAPEGENNLVIDNSFIVGVTSSWGLGFIYNQETQSFSKISDKLMSRYFDILGDKFGFRDSESHGIRLLWESGVSKYGESE